MSAPSGVTYTVGDSRYRWWTPSTGWYSGNPSTTVTRVCYKHELTRDLRSLIWANVERDYYSSAPVNFAAIALQAAWRRLRAILRIPDIWVNIDTGPSEERWSRSQKRREAYANYSFAKYYPTLT